MKETLIIISVLLLTFVPNILFKNYLEKTGEEIITILDSMNEDFENNKSIDEEKNKNLKEDFLSKEKKWILIVDHEILDEIESEIETCIVSYKEKDKMEFGISYNKVLNHIKDLKLREEISVENIF